MPAMPQRPDPGPAANLVEADLGVPGAERADRMLLYLVLCSGTATLLLALATSLAR
jgi:hypothetical protein